MGRMYGPGVTVAISCPLAEVSRNYAERSDRKNNPMARERTYAPSETVFPLPSVRPAVNSFKHFRAELGVSREIDVG